MQNQTTTYKLVDPVSPILFTAFSLILVAYPQLPTWRIKKPLNNEKNTITQWNRKWNRTDEELAGFVILHVQEEGLGPYFFFNVFLLWKPCVKIEQEQYSAGVGIHQKQKALFTQIWITAWSKATDRCG